VSNPSRLSRLVRVVAPIVVVLAGGTLVIAGVAWAFAGGSTVSSDATTAPGVTTAPPATNETGEGAVGAAHGLAPRFAGLTGWINAEPVSLEELSEARQVVLIDFWTYTCVNCIRTLPFLRDWHEKYGDRGLTIIGVHAPEFEFEKSHDNVVAAVERHELRYAIAQDNEMATWDSFANRFWPAKYLIGVDGSIRFRHFGEGEYDVTEQEIRLALTDAGYDVSDIPEGGVAPPELDPAVTGITRELYGGYLRNFSAMGIYAGQEEYYRGPDRTVEYTDDVEHFNHRWYLQGEWRNEAEAIVHARTTEALEDYLLFPFVARSVNVVMKPLRDEPFEVVVELDGRPLTEDEAGADVTFDGEGRSVLHVEEPRMYAVIELPALGEHELTLRSNSDNFAIFAVTFGAYTEGA
jgi:thiol-disulfide isomerase/thioredoxin